MSRIDISCPSCGKQIKIDIATIDRLRMEKNLLEKENQNLKIEIRALKLRESINPFGSIFGR